MPGVNDLLLNQVSDSVKVVLDLSARIDERIKIMSQNQMDQEKDLVQLKTSLTEAATRVRLLEALDFPALRKETESVLQKIMVMESKNLDALEKRVQVVELKLEGYGHGQKTMEDKIKTFVDIFWKLALPIIVGVMLYKFGFK